YGPAGNCTDLGLAGPNCLAVQLDGAGATLSESAAEAQALEAHFVSEHVEERCIRIRLHSVVLAVHLDGQAAARKQPRALREVGPAAQRHHGRRGSAGPDRCTTGLSTPVAGFGAVSHRLLRDLLLAVRPRIATSVVHRMSSPRCDDVHQIM